MIKHHLEAAAIPVEGIMVRRSWQRHLPTFLMVFGPGLIVMETDNDAVALSTYGRTRSTGEVLRLGCGCTGVKPALENSTLRREL
jgi:hypothetical protein